MKLVRAGAERVRMCMCDLKGSCIGGDMLGNGAECGGVVFWAGGMVWVVEGHLTMCSKSGKA